MDKYLESMNTARQLEDTIKEYENERIKQLISVRRKRCLWTLRGTQNSYNIKMS